MAKETIETAKIKLPPGLPFSKGIRKGHHVYMSGAVSFNEKGEFVGERDIYQQTFQVLKDLCFQSAVRFTRLAISAALNGAGSRRPISAAFASARWASLNPAPLSTQTIRSAE